MNRVIKALGLYPVRVVLHPEVGVEVSVNVARTEEEAKLQAAGVDVTAADRDTAAEEAAMAAQEAFEPEALEQVESGEAGEQPETGEQPEGGWEQPETEA
jgi:large subunit ribosomal protein L9